MKLYQLPFSPSCQKVVPLAHEVGVALTTVNIDIFKGQAKSPEMLAKNPIGKLPILEDDDFVLCARGPELVPPGDPDSAPAPATPESEWLEPCPSTLYQGAGSPRPSLTSTP